MLTGLLFGQDVLTHKSGKIYKGKFYGIVEQNIVFYVEGETSNWRSNKMFPIREVTSIETSDGELTYPFDVPITNERHETLNYSVTNFDILILKSGTTYFGEYSKIEEEIVYFKPQDTFAFQQVPVKLIKNLQLKDGQIINVGGKVKNSLTLEEYQKLSTKEKAIYDANLYNLNKWALYGPMSTILFGGCVLLKDYFNKKQILKKDMIRLESPIFLGGSLAASLTIPYFVLNKKFYFPKSILNITDSEKEIYEQAYSKKLKQRKIKYAVGSTILAEAVFVGVGLYSFGQAMKGFDMGRFG